MILTPEDQTNLIGVQIAGSRSREYPSGRLRYASTGQLQQEWVREEHISWQVTVTKEWRDIPTEGNRT